jgi:biotin-(acetyl-CoA carboxylase) ligase
VWFDEVDSTNLVAARLVASWGEDDEGARLADTLVLAGRQSGGRGRGGKVWVSPAGGLYASWLGWLPVASLEAVPLGAAVCLPRPSNRNSPGCRSV